MSIVKISEPLLENIEEEISVVIQKEKQFSFDPFFRGYHGLDMHTKACNFI